MKKKLIPLFLIATVFISCIPDEKGTAGTAGGSQKPSAAARVVADKGPPDVKPDSSRVKFSDISEPEGRDFLLYNETSGQIVFPKDFEIGELQNMITADETTLAIFGTAEKFLKTIVGGEPDEEYIASEKKEFVKRNLEEETAKADITDFRIGLINPEAEPARAAVRILSETGFAEGVLYFIRDDIWKIQDFQIDFSGLDKKENDHSEWFPYNKVM